MNSQTNFIELELYNGVSPRRIAVQAQKIEWIDLLMSTIYLTSGKSIVVTKESAEKAYQYVLRYAIPKGE